MSALPPISDIHLFCNRQGIVHINPEVSNRAFDLTVPKKQLHGAQVARAAVDQRRLGSAK